MTEAPSIVMTRRVVPNLQPLSDPGDLRVAVIGEAPGEDEENHRYPFVGRSGQFLDNLLRDAGLDRHKMLIGNVCQVRPPANNISLFKWDGPEIQSGLAQLQDDLNLFNPNISILLGNTPLRAASGEERTIGAWCGSLFLGRTPQFGGRKCIAGFHPAGILRVWGQDGNFPRLKMVLKRAVEEGRSPTLTLLPRERITNATADELCYLMDTWPAGLPCSVDMEGGLPPDRVNDSVKADAKSRRHLGWKCVSICGRTTKAWCLTWWRFTEEEHGRVLVSYAGLMRRRDVPKVLQNSLYDSFVHAYGYGVLIRNIRDDTMLKGWEAYCELPKGLGVQASIWTREPHWKDDTMYSSVGDGLAQGCCTDTMVTLEISNAQDQVLKGSRLVHYRKNVEMLNPLLYMELRGIKYDKESVESQLKETKHEISQVGESICGLAGSELRGKKGSISAKRLATVLYTVKGYPPQYKKENGRRTDKLTTDIEALLNLRKKLPGDEFLNGIIKHRHLEGLIETLSIQPDPDGRVRCGYNIVGSETGRLSCYTSPTGAGANLQTITKKLRKNYVADDGFDFFQCDLAGADGWTVAAHCARLGDRTMLDDYYFGLKPAKIIVLMKDLGAVVNQLDRASVKNLCRVVDPDGWEYFAGKRIQHSGNYLAGIPTTQTIVMKDSFKLSGEPIYLSHQDTGILQHFYHVRYRGVRLWHQWAEVEVVQKGYLLSASGQVRMFFGRRFGKDIKDTVKEFLAHEPQSNTTWSTNLAMLNLWNDPDNRRPDGSLIIEPLHQVHDALCGQWPQSYRDWARRKVKSYFQNPLNIAGETITIPFEGRFGRSWGELTEEL